MASSTSNSSIVVLELKNSLLNETDIKQKEILISTEDISCWDFSRILSSQIVKVQTDRNKLIQNSSYFRSLLTGSFSESRGGSVSVLWNRETVIDVLKFIYSFPLEVSINNFIPLMEGALFFGVEALLLECIAWFSKATSMKELYALQIPLESIIEIWSFGLEHAIGCIPEQCTGYLARNFMCATSCSSFNEVPYNLLTCCLEHPHLTTDSEKDLAEALIKWLEFNTKSLEASPVFIKDDRNDILKKVRVGLLPFWFAAGRKMSSYFSELADESISAILSLVNNPPVSLLRLLKDDDLEIITIRLTDHNEIWTS